MSSDERLWTKADVAEYLGVTVRTVDRFGIPRVALAGTFGGTRPVVRFDPAEVKAWVAKRKSRTLLPKSA